MERLKTKITEFSLPSGFNHPFLEFSNLFLNPKQAKRNLIFK